MSPTDPITHTSDGPQHSVSSPQLSYNFHAPSQIDFRGDSYPHMNRHANRRATGSCRTCARWLCAGVLVEPARCSPASPARVALKPGPRPALSKLSPHPLIDQLSHLTAGTSPIGWSLISCHDTTRPSFWPISGPSTRRGSGPTSREYAACSLRCRCSSCTRLCHSPTHVT